MKRIRASPQPFRSALNHFAEGPETERPVLRGSEASVAPELARNLKLFLWRPKPGMVLSRPRFSGNSYHDTQGIAVLDSGSPLSGWASLRTAPG